MLRYPADALNCIKSLISKI